MIERCLGYVSDLRADSLKECFNLYEQEMHNMRMEKTQQDLLNVQFDMLEAAQRSEAEARATKRAAIAGAIASGITAMNVHRIRRRLE